MAINIAPSEWLLQRKRDLEANEPSSPVRVRMQTIVIEVAARHLVPVKDVLGHRRQKEIVAARFEAMWRIREELKLSYPQIGRYFDGRDHTSVWHAVRRHAETLQVAA